MIFCGRANACQITKLNYLGETCISAKLMHSEHYSEVITYALYLAPANHSGYEVCPARTAECTKACLSTSGLAALDIVSGRDTIQKARIKKTQLFFEHREFFMQWLFADIAFHRHQAAKRKMKFACRLNCTSDIDWADERINGVNVFEQFPDVQFYDYTKRFEFFSPSRPGNYHLTKSFTGNGFSRDCELLEEGFNVAIVFNIPRNRPLPIQFDRYRVVDGDLTDYRPADGHGVIVGLRFKKIADKQAQKEVATSRFVISPHDERCQYKQQRIKFVWN